MIVSPIFARHETFHPRHGWLKKGFDCAKKDPNVFLREDATTILGVGKNMVRAIRYWCSAFKILEETSRNGNKGKGCMTTVFGEQLLSDDGWDPYLESNASLWLLHWKLVQSYNFATAWNYTFNEFHLVDFTENHLFHALTEYMKKAHPSGVVLILRKN